MIVVVTGANGLVGSRLCTLLSRQGVDVRAVVRRAGTAPAGPGIVEHVGNFPDAGSAAAVLAGADAAVTTVHPMGSPLDVQRRIGVEGTTTFARAAVSAGVARLAHVSTAAVYDRSPGVGDVDESSALVGDDTNAYGVTKRDTDTALASIDGITRVLLRPPAILGPGPSSIWNTVHPQEIREDEEERRTVPEKTFAWVHVDDLARFAADIACDHVAAADDPQAGPVTGACTAVNVAAGPARARDYYGTVTKALGVEPVWEQGAAWTGQILAGRAHAWGWTPTVDLSRALDELAEGLRG
jgi:nucleoside-diphosphate-sugar epimerase